MLGLNPGKPEILGEEDATTGVDGDTFFCRGLTGINAFIVSVIQRRLRG